MSVNIDEYSKIDNLNLIINKKDEQFALEREKVKIKNDIDSVKVVEPESYYHEDEHDKIKEEYNQNYKEKIQLDTKISDIQSLKSSVSSGIKCEHCGIELINAAITQNKINELAGLIVHKTQIEGLMNDLSRKDADFVKLKKEFDEYKATHP